MIRKLSVSLAALAAMGIAGAASAQNVTGSPATVDIDVTVQEIAMLEVIEGSASAVVDSSGDYFMPNPSSSGSDLANFAELQLQTNFNVGAIQLNFPTMNNVQAGPGLSTWYGEALCESAGTCGGTTAIGVWPQIGEISGGETSGQALWSHSGLNEPLLATGPHRENCTSPSGPNICEFTNGTHNMAVGVAANWDRTLLGEPQFASPGKYEIQLTATIVP